MPEARLRTVVALIAATLVVLGGCASAPGGPATQIQVTIADNSINATPASAPAGAINLAITNSGTVEHEIEVFTLPSGVDPAGLTINQGVADTANVGMQVIDEVEGIVPNGTPSLAVTLAAGRYALICNLPGHYGLGMHTTLTVQ